jgi:hypothetical protein
MDILKQLLLMLTIVAFIIWSNDIGASAKNAQACETYTGDNAWMIYLCHNG